MSIALDDLWGRCFHPWKFTIEARNQVSGSEPIIQISEVLATINWRDFGNLSDWGCEVDIGWNA
jgi:hypothetical protein